VCVCVGCEVRGSAVVVGEDGGFERDRYVDGELELWSLTLSRGLRLLRAATAEPHVRSILGPAS
jgi:hypothetical protein